MRCEIPFTPNASDKTSLNMYLSLFHPTAITRNKILNNILQ